MSRQQPLALPPPAGHADWTEQVILDAGTHRALSSLNYAFLDLAAELADEGRLRLIGGLPQRVVNALIDPEAQRRLCERLPFALFDLRFGDSAFWESQAAAVGGVQDGQLVQPADERVVVFVRSVIVLAWHLAQVSALGVRLVFGAGPPTITVLAALPVAAVEDLARRLAPILCARFGARARFWLQFEGYVTDPCDDAMRLLQQLGLQIQGAESARQQSLQRRFRRVAPA